MSKTITISFPVADLAKSMHFYAAIGFVKNPQFADDTACMMVWSDAINVMLLTHERWRSFSDRPIPPVTSSEMALNIALESRDDVDVMIQKVTDNGGVADINPPQDHGFMYGRDFIDPDGHVWGPYWMTAAD